MEKLALDIDEVIIEFLRPFLEDHYNPKHKTTLTPEEFFCYRWWEVLKIPKEQAYHEAKEFITLCVLPQEEPGVLGHNAYRKFVPGAEAALDLLSRSYELHAITDRSELLEPNTFNLSSALYVDEDTAFYPDIPIPKELDDDGGLILPANRIHDAAASGRTKADVCRHHGIRRIVEDNADTALDCAQHGIEVLLLTKPWNKRARTHPLIRRMADWQAVCDELSPVNRYIYQGGMITEKY